MGKLIITTTSKIENATVEKYYGVVNANVIVGTNFFSDLTASLSDIFGGTSGTYRKQMDSLYEKAYDAISVKASRLGANGIIGFSLDFDEISGKGKSMFMISASGTAVKLKLNTSSDIFPENTVSSEELAIQLFKLEWQKKGYNYMPTISDWDFILSNNLVDIAEDLFDKYIFSRLQHPYESGVETMTSKFPLFVGVLEYSLAQRVLYKDYKKNHLHVYSLIKEHKLFSPQIIKELVKNGEINLAIELLNIDKEHYTKDDLLQMQEIEALLDTLPDKGRYETVKAGLISSKMVEVYFCPNGHKNNIENIYCDHSDCCQNIKGLTVSQVWEIQKFKDRISVLSTILKR